MFSPSGDSSTNLSLGSHTVRGGIDPGDRHFRPRLEL